MTLQEIKERIAVYESKWGKLGHTNIMKPENELQHSELNERRNTMIKTTNDFYKFRQKVAIGKEANKLAHKATISPEELNERNFQNQIDNNTLIHAGKKGEKFENAKYYAREGEPGNYRYFYTQEEYDAYKRGKQNAANVAPGVDNAGKQNATKEDYKQRSQASEDFNRENDKRWAYEISKNTKSGESNFERKILADEKGKQMDRDLGYVDKIKEDLSKGVRRVIRRDDNPVGELMDYIEDAFDDNKLRMDEKGNMTGDEKVIAKIQEMSKEAEKYGKSLADNFGTEGSKNVWDEFQKQTEDKISFLTRAYNVKDEALKAYDEGGEDAVAEYLINTDEWKDFEKEVRKLIGAGKVRINRDNSGYSKMSNEDSDIVSNLEEKIEDYVEIIGDGTGIKRSAIRKLLDKEIMNFAMARSEDKYEANSNGKDNYNSGDKKFANTNKETDEYLQAKTKKEIDNWKRRDENNAKNNGSRGKNWGYNPDNNPERNRYMKHSSIADIRAEKEESIMSEYRAFKARANKGAEKNRLSHSAVISPRDLNAKYEEELAKEYIAIHPENDDFESLSHSGQNFKYYNKIDLPNGTTRYFYSKAEWDAYQDGLGQSKKQEQERIVKKNADAAAHEGDRYAKKPLPKSATMTDEERKEMYEGLVKKAKIHNQQLKNFENNKEAAKHEGDRYLKKIDDTLKKIDAPLKDVENKPQPVAPEVTKVEVEVETPNNANNKEADIINVRNSINNSQEAHDYAYLIAWQSLYGPDSLNSEGQKIVNDDINYLTQELDNLYNNAEAKYGAGAGEEFVNVANGKIDELINMYYTQLVAEWNNEINRQQQEIINQQNMWNMMMMQSSFNDEDDKDSLSHNSNGYGGAYLHKLDDFYGPGKPRYFYSEADWNAYQEGLKRNNYNADKEAEAKQAKTDKQKADLARRSGMENYTKYQENKRADEEADARQAKIDEQKTRAKQKAGMEGYEQWNEKRQAEKEANAKKVAEDRNDMSGYAAWKRRRDYINNQKKASEAADAAEAEKHEIERKAVKNSVEVTKNKAAAKAQEAAEAEKRESAKRKKDEESKNAAIKAGQESASKLHAENEAKDKEHKADKEKAKWNNLNNNVTSILEKASKKYDNQLEALNKEYDSIKDKSSPEAKAIKDKISQTNTKKDAELDKEIMTVVKDLGEIFESLEDKNGPEAKLLKAQAKRALDYSSNTKLAKVMGDANSWLNASMKYPKEV